MKTVTWLISLGDAASQRKYFSMFGIVRFCCGLAYNLQRVHEVQYTVPMLSFVNTGEVLGTICC